MKKQELLSLLSLFVMASGFVIGLSLIGWTMAHVLVLGFYEFAALISLGAIIFQSGFLVSGKIEELAENERKKAEEERRRKNRFRRMAGIDKD